MSYTKYYWRVSFNDGSQVTLNSARGWKQAHLAAVRQSNRVDAVEVRRIDASTGNYKSWPLLGSVTRSQAWGL